MVCKCFIVDDDPPAVKVLQNFIDTVPQLEITGTCQNAVDAFKLLQKERADLLFLELKKSKPPGNDLIKSLPHPPHIIFTSAHKDTEVKAFEIEAVDYLHKPISYERFLKAVNRILPVTPLLVENSLFKIGFVYFKAERKMIKVILDEILYIESYRDYVIIHLEKERELKVKLPLNCVERMLPGNQFLRIHRSFLVSIPKISAFTKTDVEIGRTELPIGKSFNGIFHRLTSS